MLWVAVFKGLSVFSDEDISHVIMEAAAVPADKLPKSWAH